MIRKSVILMFGTSSAVWAMVGCQAGGQPGMAQAGELPPDRPVARMRVSGLSCPLCAHNIHQQLMDVPGVLGVRVDLGAGKVLVSLDHMDAVAKRRLGKAIEDSGFGLIEFEMMGAASKSICSACECKLCSCAVALKPCGSDCSCRS